MLEIGRGDIHGDTAVLCLFTNELPHREYASLSEQKKSLVRCVWWDRFQLSGDPRGPTVPEAGASLGEGLPVPSPPPPPPPDSPLAKNPSAPPPAHEAIS